MIPLPTAFPVDAAADLGTIVVSGNLTTKLGDVGRDVWNIGGFAIGAVAHNTTLDAGEIAKAEEGAKQLHAIANAAANHLSAHDAGTHKIGDSSILKGLQNLLNLIPGILAILQGLGIKLPVGASVAHVRS
jgi:hypothetical protein